jgi:hypothetical protein
MILSSFQAPHFCSSCQLGQAPEAAGFVATYSQDSRPHPVHSVLLGVVTGVLVWGITRFLDGRRR